jgi:hypothetical protein
MRCAELVAWGLRRLTHVRRVLAMGALLAALPASSCDDGPGKIKAVECRVDEDCDASELGICDIALCVEGRCELDSRPDGHRCDDSDPLTGEDACLSGVCAGTAKACEDDLGPCLMAVGDPVTGECLVEPVENGSPCDDANACTQADSCQTGECVGAEPVTCEATDDCHVAGECDPETGACKDVSAPDGTTCDDAQTCTSNDSCVDGACAGVAVPCDDGLACSVDSCDETSGACASDMSQCSCVNDQDCNDGNACNGAEICDAASKLCQRGTPVVCGPSGDACLTNVCEAETGACVPEPVQNGTACDDASACTGRDTCQSGVCVGGDAVVCTALSQCHIAGVCDASTGQCSNPEKPGNSTCNDGNACTATDRCQAGACVGTGQVTCQASDQCHDSGVCNAKTGACSNPNKQDGVSCNDGNACSKGDACQAGACTPSAQVTCTALDSCHAVGACDPTTGVCSNPAKLDGTACNDGLTCTTADKCTAGKCGGSPAVCNDNVACTVDSCSEQLGGCTANSSACACKTSADCNDNNPCNGVEQCNLQTLQCQPGTAVDCSTFNDACNVGVCNVATGGCLASPKQNGTSCDDADLCTSGSSCQAGTCKGSGATVCTASDQCHDAGSCNPSTGKCSNPAKNNGSLCNDGNACTKTDTCQTGICTGSSPVLCPASDQCHTAGTCDTSTGLCDDPAKKNGSACSDGSACTQTDTCQGGVCLGASPVTCGASDQCHTAGTCDPATGSCSDPAKKDGTACVDSSLCTQIDTCQAGVCTGASPVTCGASDQCHTVGTCDGATGKCSNPAKPDGTACVDNSLCTQTDSCQAGTCTGANPITCPASDQCHDAGTCDAATGKCSNPTKPDNTPCNDAKACTSSDKCSNGACGGSAVTCNDGITCTVDTCQEPTGCNFDQSKCGCAKDADCNDGNACNGVETCNLGTLSCVAGTAVSCTGLDDACNVGVCDSKTGACKATPRLDGTGCDDGNACTKVDSCTAGKCLGSSAVVCTASDQCHDVGSCDTKTGVCSNPNKTNGSGCNDGDACTKTDTCQSGACTGGNPVTCVASDQCHSAGTCDSKTGTCSNPVKTGPCDDGNKCTQTDGCSAGVCVGSNPVVCAASDQCHDAGTCVSATGVCTQPAKTDGSKCDDSNACTLSDTCQGGACKSGTPKTCTLLGPCYKLGVCDTKSGECSNPFADTTTTCDDGNLCTASDKCDGKGSCSSGSAVVCQPPADPCKTNVCKPAVGCEPGDQPIGTPCDDASACTQLDQCATGGVCKGGDPRANVNADWSDDPGSSDAGPTSVDIFSDKDGNAHVVGTYRGQIRFNDKEDPKIFSPLLLPSNQTTGIYWTMYKETGEIASAFNVGGGTSTLTVVHAAGHRDGSFTLLGVFQGRVVFGRDGTTTKTLSASTDQVYVAHYFASGSIAWVAQFVPGSKTAFTAASVAVFDDDSVVATGDSGGSIIFNDANGTSFAKDDRVGVWAARLDRDGAGQWGRVVAAPQQGSITAHAVATLDDGGAAFTGTFSFKAALGPNGEVPVTTAGGDNDSADVWFMKLDKASNLGWGGRVGGESLDYAGDFARLKDGGALLLATTNGADPNASDSKTTQPLFSTSPSTLQTHVINIDRSGVMSTAGLIASVEAGGALGYQLDLDYGGTYSVAGVFATGTRLWSKLGFGSGFPKNPANITLASSYQGPLTLFAARVDPGCAFPWAVQAGGDNSGMITAPWDIVLTGHTSHSLTVAGMFKSTAIFGDRVTEQLQSYEKVGNPFVVHLNSEAEYDYCR